MSVLRHDNFADMNVLSSMVKLVPVDMQTAFAAALLGRDLMRGPWWLQGLVWCVRSIRGWAKTTTWYLFLSRFQRGMPEQIVREFARHINHGTDLSDPRSVGGLNQREVEDTVFVLRNVLRNVDLPPTYRAALGATPSSSGGDHG